jgi:hypothetical protein
MVPMFLTTKYSGYNRDGEQVAAGPYLMVFHKQEIGRLGGELRALVRYVRLRQCGHFMGGIVRVGPHPKVYVEGAYGSMGLPMDPPSEAVWEQALPFPKELEEAFWKGGGHNTCGNEAGAVRAWAQANLPRLRQWESPPRPKRKRVRKPHEAYDRMLDRARSLHGNIISCFWRALDTRCTEEQLDGWLRDQVYNRPDWKRLPQYKQYELRGYAHGRLNQLETTELEQRVRLNGEWIPFRAAVRPEEVKELARLQGHRDPDGRYRVEVDWRPGRFWKGTDRPFYLHPEVREEAA